MDKGVCRGLLATQGISSTTTGHEPDEVIFAYIAVALYAVSLVLIQVDNGVQRPVYYVSKSLHEVGALSTTRKSYPGSGAWHA